MGNISEYSKSDNIADMLDSDTLAEIGTKVVYGYDIDLQSRSEWENLMSDALKLAKQIKEPKKRPNMDKSANIKYPLITKSAIDFAARVYPEIVQGNRVVYAKVTGNDPGNLKARQAARVSKHMSYQLLDETNEWEDGLDSLLGMLPIFGTVFKKIYYDVLLKRNVSMVISPEDIVVHQSIDSLEKARRITHKLTMHKNEVIERMRAGLFSKNIDIDQLMPSVNEPSVLEVDPGEKDDLMDDDAPLTLLEQHCYLDLDEDGYEEPYVVTVNKDNAEVLRIVARYEKIERKDGELLRIVPEHYFVDFHFIRNPDGGYYSIGLGSLLAPINESINSIINQLIDSGSLANMQSGFVGKGLRLKNGQISVKNGQWTVLDTATGTDLKNNIVPLPTKEPSPTLFNLLGLLIEAGKDIASVNDVLQGKQPAQNVPATTVLTLVEQGLKVYNSVVKRIYRSMRKEFKRLFALNLKHVSDKEYQRVLDDELASVRFDYDMETMDVSPVADPSVSSDAQRLARARALLEVPTLDPYAVSKAYLEALQIEESKIDQLLPPPNPDAPPPPDMQKIMAEVEKLKVETQAIIAEQQLKIAELQVKQIDTGARAQESQARTAKMGADALNNNRKLDIVSDKSAVETEIKSRDQIRKEVSGDRELDQKDLELMLKALEAGENEGRDEDQ